MCNVLYIVPVYELVFGETDRKTNFSDFSQLKQAIVLHLCDYQASVDLVGNSLVVWSDTPEISRNTDCY